MTVAQATRLVVVVSTIVAALVEVWLATTYALPVFWIAVAGFVILLITGSRIRAVALPGLMAAVYLTPAVLLAVRGGEDFSQDIIWILPLLGLCVSGALTAEWSLPARWQWPLVTWAVLVSIVWPIVFLREADFALWILPLEKVSNTSVGMGPWQVGLNIVYFAIGHNVGILFIDALCRWYATARDAFRREVLSAMAGAALVAGVVAFYQGFVDLAYLNRGFWAYMLRASGTLGDANKLGAVAAFWTVGAVVFARRMTAPWPQLMAVVAVVAGVGSVWLSGSRTGLAAVIVSVFVAGLEALRHWLTMRRESPLNTGRAVAYGVGIVVLVAGLVTGLQNASTHTIVARGTLGYLPFIGDKSIAQSANELLWERFGYGPAAIQMVKEHPIDGIGVGMFHSQVIDFGKAVGYAGDDTLATDNAQSWFRHVIAEFGLVGAIPMLWWSVVLTMMLFGRRTAGDRLSSGMLRGVLLGFGVASTFGMPAQSIAIIITFWVFVFWFSIESAAASPAPKTALSRSTIALAAALIVVHVGMTTVDAFGELRPRERAQRFNWFYRYGFLGDGDPEPDPGGNALGRRWTTRDALAVIPVKGRVLKFVAWIDHPDSDQKPVHTRVWADSHLVYEGDLKRSSPLFLDIPATPGKSHMVLETSIDRLWRPSDFGTTRDRRELGLSIRDWTWE